MAVSERITTLSPAGVVSRGTGLLITDPLCSAEVRAAYEQTFLNVRFALLSGASATLLVSAVDASASAVALAANIGILAANEGERVVVVDADAHTPALESVYGLGDGVGFTNLVQADASDVAAALQPVVDVPNLRLLGIGTAGPVPGGLGRGKGLTELFLRLKTVADRVVIIGAPILTHLDSLELSPLVDGVLVAVRPGKTHRLDARRAREVLNRVRAPLLGVVLTRKAL